MSSSLVCASLKCLADDRFRWTRAPLTSPPSQIHTTTPFPLPLLLAKMPFSLYYYYYTFCVCSKGLSKSVTPSCPCLSLPPPPLSPSSSRSAIGQARASFWSYPSLPPSFPRPPSRTWNHYVKYLFWPPPQRVGRGEGGALHHHHHHLNG